MIKTIVQIGMFLLGVKAGVTARLWIEVGLLGLNLHPALNNHYDLNFMLTMKFIGYILGGVLIMLAVLAYAVWTIKHWWRSIP